MLKKIAMGILASVISVNVAVAAPNSQVKAAIEDYKFAMTVEGAALDPELARLAQDDLRANLKALLASGVSQDEILETILASIQDTKARTDLMEALAHVQSTGMDQKEAEDFLMNTLARSSQNGASWNGTTGLIIVAGLVVVLVAVVVITVKNHECSTNENQTWCLEWN